MPPLPPLEIVQHVSQKLHLSWELVYAVCLHETPDGQLIDTCDDGTKSYGWMKVHAPVLAQMPGLWGDLNPQDLVDRPELGIEVGCRMLRWWVYEAARALALPGYPTLPGDTPDYSRFPAWVATLAPADRARLYYRAALAYTWPQSLTKFEQTPGPKLAHADKIVRTWKEWSGE